MKSSANDTTKFLLEIKDAAAIEHAVQLVFDEGIADRCNWCSFSRETNRKILKEYSDRGSSTNVTISLNSAVFNYQDYVDDGIFCLAYGMSQLTQEITDMTFAAGLQVDVWTVDTEAAMRKFMGYKVYSITTNYARNLMSLISSLRKEDEEKLK